MDVLQDPGIFADTPAGKRKLRSMKLHCKKTALNLCFATATVLCAVSAGAQLAGSVGGSLSPSLDTNLNGLDSSVAPTPSGTIEPGASNLMTPEERVLPYDPTGASIMATPMSPWPLQFYQSSRIPYQVDNSLKDVTIVTGLRSALPLNISDIIARKSEKLQSSSLSSGSTSIPGVGVSSQRVQPAAAGSLTGTIAQQSFWRAGAAATVTAINPVQPFSEPVQTSVLPSNSATDNKASIRKKSKTPLDEMTGLPGSASAVPPDYSRSPLETSYEDQSDATVAAGPFRSLDQSSFLNTEINAHSLRRSPLSTKQKTASLFGDQTQSTAQARITDTMHDQNMNTAQSRLAKHSIRTEQIKRPKWHNPILQQMESSAVSGRQ
jgi:hypothetical protein